MTASLHKPRTPSSVLFLNNMGTVQKQCSSTKNTAIHLRYATLKSVSSYLTKWFGKFSSEIVFSSLNYILLNLVHDHLSSNNQKSQGLYKLRYDHHIHSFSHEHLKNQTALSIFGGTLKNRGLTPKIQWKFLKRSFDGRCNLCLEEKIQIMMYIDPFNLLNQRCDFIARCRLRNKFRLV